MKSIRECHREAELDVGSLVWTRGDAFPIARLSGRLRCPACRSLQVAVMFVPPSVERENRGAARGAADRSEDFSALEFRVEQWGPDDKLERILAASANALVARGAYDAAVIEVRLQPGAKLTLRHRTRVLAEHPRDLSAARRLVVRQ